MFAHWVIYDLKFKLLSGSFKKTTTTVDLKNPLHKSRCTFQKCFHTATLPARFQRMEYIFRYESGSSPILLYF